MPQDSYTSQNYERDRAFLNRAASLDLGRLPISDLISLLRVAGCTVLRTGTGQSTPLERCGPQQLYAVLQGRIRQTQRRVAAYIPPDLQSSPQDLRSFHSSESMDPSKGDYPFLPDGIESLVARRRLPPDAAACDWLDYMLNPGIDN